MSVKKSKSNESIISALSNSSFGSCESIKSITSESSCSSKNNKSSDKVKLFYKKNIPIPIKRRKKDQFLQEIGKSPTIEDALSHIIRKSSGDWGHYTDI
jgi:hypothetical protein